MLSEDERGAGNQFHSNLAYKTVRIRGQEKDVRRGGVCEREETEGMKERLTGKMIQIKNAEKLPKNAITFPNPGSNIAVTTQTPVVTILDPTLNTAFIFSFDFILSPSTVSRAIRSGFDIDEVNI